MRAPQLDYPASVRFLGLDWNEQDAKDLLRGLAAAVLSALVIAYVLRRGLGAKV